MKTFCVLLLSIVCGNARAWEVDTHAWITLRAFERSQLKAGTPEGDALLRRPDLIVTIPKSFSKVPA